jgi:hypothetical protein
MNKRTLLALAVVVFCLCGCEAQRIEAEANLTEAKAELTEAETSQESQKALSEVVSELLTELGAERERSDRSYREVVNLLTELMRSKERTSRLWGIMALVSVGGAMFAFASAVVAAVLLSHCRDRTIVMLPPGAYKPWLPVGSTDLVSWQEQGAMQTREAERQEIAIE